MSSHNHLSKSPPHLGNSSLFFFFFFFFLRRCAIGRQVSPSGVHGEWGKERRTYGIQLLRISWRPRNGRKCQCSAKQSEVLFFFVPLRFFLPSISLFPGWGVGCLHWIFCIDSFFFEGRKKGNLKKQIHTITWKENGIREGKNKNKKWTCSWRS